MAAVETAVFDGKCDAYMEGYRFVPEGAVWTREDGQVFRGEMIAPWTDHEPLETAQRKYEQAQLADMKQALATLGVTLDD